jgi:prolyl oligopeptidase PreP (S9A serine peptidase family)
MHDGRARVSRWPWRGKPTPLALPYEGWTPDLATDLALDGIVFQIEGWLRPGTYVAYEPAKQKLAPTGLASSTTADVSMIVAEEVEATSADGTKVPLSILHRKDAALDGSHPTLLSAYGGYGVSQTPGFSPSRVAWIERGGVYAIAHVRGGGEKGRRWQDRVAPWMSSKLAARLSAATTGKRPILIRVDAEAGHGIGSTRDQGFAECADVWSFFLHTFAEADSARAR